jgi:hypothetical protein
MGAKVRRVGRRSDPAPSLLAWRSRCPEPNSQGDDPSVTRGRLDMRLDPLAAMLGVGPVVR